jgi:hypothetical protein
MRTSILVLALACVAACDKSSSSTPPTTEPDTTTPDQKPTPDEQGVERPKLTAAACEEQGGKVVGDIGDGAIHRPDYKCPDSGEAPIGSIVPDPGGAVAVEGSVCCK